MQNSTRKSPTLYEWPPLSKRSRDSQNDGKIQDCTQYVPASTCLQPWTKSGAPTYSKKRHLHTHTRDIAFLEHQEHVPPKYKWAPAIPTTLAFTLTQNYIGGDARRWRQRLDFVWRSMPVPTMTRQTGYLPPLTWSTCLSNRVSLILIHIIAQIDVIIKLQGA